MDEERENVEIETEDSTTELQPKKGTDKKSRALAWVTGSVVALCSFCGGLLVGQLGLDPEMRTLIKLKEIIQSEYYQEIDDETFYQVLFDAINGELLDAYSQYMTIDEYSSVQTAAKGQTGGIGCTFMTKSLDGKPQMLITRVSGNSPAEAAGIREGMYLVGFGMEQNSITESSAFSDFSAFIDPLGAGEEFCLKFLDGEEDFYVTIAKSTYVESYVFYRTKDNAYGFGGEKATELMQKGYPLETLDEATAYIRLTRFNGSAGDEFAKAMDQFKADGKKNLVLDLRGNGGGYMNIMQEIGSYFCKEATERKPDLVYADYGERQDYFKAEGNYYYDYFSEDSRICVLADSSTASASECLIGSMLDYGAIDYSDICLIERNGVAKTYGKGIMQTTYPLGIIKQDAVKLTTAVIRWPVTGHCIHGVGVLPSDGALTVTESYERDAEIKESLRVLFE